MTQRLELLVEDITQLSVDVIVNAANSALSGGGGVDGAIHRAGGPELTQASRALGPCKTGEAVITPGFLLKAKWVVHAVGPVWKGGAQQEQELLARCYRRSLELAAEVNATSIAFPCISTGAYRFPPDPAAAIALATVREALSRAPSIERVIFCCYSTRDERHYVDAAERESVTLHHKRSA